MEKKSNIFDVNLDSLMNTPIDVEAVNDNAYPEELFRDKLVDKKDEPQKKADEDKDLIDLDSNVEEEEEEIDEKEDIQGRPSSENEPPHKAESKKTSSPLTPYAKLLVDEGVLPNLNLEEFDGTSDGLKDAMVSEIVGAVENYKETLPPRIKQLIDNYEDGVPLEKLLELDKAETDISKIESGDLEKVEVQKKVITDYLKRTTKFSDAKISKQIETYEDSGELEEEAKSSFAELKSLVAADKEKEKKTAEANRKAEEEARKKEIIALQEKVKGIEEIIPGMKVNDRMKNTVLSSMTTPVGYDQVGRPVNRIVAARMENPVEFEIRLHYLFEITKGFTDFSKIKSEGKKDSLKTFEKAIDEIDNKDFTEHKEESLDRKSNNFLKGLSKVYNI